MEIERIVSAILLILILIGIPLCLTIYYSEPLILAVFALLVVIVQFGFGE